MPDPEPSEAEREAAEDELHTWRYINRLNLHDWAALSDVTPTDAAMLLCGLNPDKVQQHTDQDPSMLARRFSDHAQLQNAPLRLADWWKLAREWMDAKNLGFITLSCELSEALALLDSRRLPNTEPAAGQPQAAAPTPVVADSARNAAAWTVTKPQRYNGYAAPLHRLIANAHREGRPRPTAHDVVEAWRTNRPAEVAQVLPDGFDYYDAKGNTKPASLEAIRKAIGRMTSAR